MTRGVVVTGMGVTTPLGGDVASTWENLLAGRPGVTSIPEDWQPELPSRVGAFMTVDPAGILERSEVRRLDRSQQAALIAFREAWADAGRPEIDPDRLGTVVATGIGGVVSLLEQYEIMNEKGPTRVSPMGITMIMPNGPAAVVGLEIGARAGVHTPVSACASGAEAIAYGADMIRTGRADIVVAGGTEACIHPLTLSLFASMRALSKRNDDPRTASRPYDIDRDGFVMGEGAGIVVLEAEEHARARGARIHGVFAGSGLTSDGHHIAQPDPEGRGATRAIRAALADAGLTTQDIVHINAHATSTPQGDIAESVAIRAAFGGATDSIVVTGSKSMTGHLLGGAGAVESVFTILALRDRICPPTANLTTLDPQINLDIAVGEPRALPAGDIAAVNNSFGFGGHDVALVFRSPA